MLLPAGAESTFPDFPAQAASEYAISAQNEGLTIGLEPVDDTKDQTTYFHIGLAAKGFVPIFVVIQNVSNLDTFLFDSSKITCGPEDSVVSTPKTGSNAGKALGLSAIPFIGIIPAIRVISNASEVQQNALKKELRSTTLSPGASVHGFLFVPIPKNAARGKIRIRIPISKASSDESFVLDLVF
jgi:hypothetical protein